MLKKILNISVQNWTILFLSWMIFMFWFSVYFELGLNWKMLIVIWTVIAIFVRLGGFLKNTPISFKKLWLFSIFFYTILETTIRIFIAKELIANSWRTLNLLEHFFWMTFTLILVYPFFYKMLKKLNSFHKFLYLFGFLMTIGIFNEIFEFIMRVRLQIPVDKLAYYYEDTIYDLTINIPGVIFGMILIYFFDRKELIQKENFFDNFAENKAVNKNEEIKKKKSRFSKFLKRLLILGFVIVLFVFSVNFYILKSSQSQIYSQVSDLPEYQTALLLGAKVYNNEVLSFVMQDRADTAIEIYQAGKVQKILVSGDHGTENYDEVNAIKNYLLKNGVDKDDVFLDHAGFDTYDSVYRAKEIFGVESMIIVTQEFHLPRAIFIANKLEIKNVGIIADKRPSFLINSFREIIARIKAFFNVTFNNSPKFLGDQIPITGESSKSWD